MMKKLIIVMVILFSMLLLISGCSKNKEDVKIGVSFGVGMANRWEQEKLYMINHAKELGVDIEVRLNKGDTRKTQQQDCIEMIDSGIDVLVLTPRDVKKVDKILEYAKKKNVPVISYARIVLGKKVDLFVGYDSDRLGQQMGQYLSEKVYSGNYIILRGDEGDNNAELLYNGAMRYIAPIKSNIDILLDAPVPEWSPDEAKKMVIEAITKADGKIDAIMAPNDRIAKVCADALVELGVKNHVAITGMDAELDAAKRIVSGTQDMTIYMDLEELATIAVEEAVHIATDEKVNVNAKFDNHSSKAIDANLITGQTIVKQNLDRILIESGYFTKEQVYGTN